MASHDGKDSEPMGRRRRLVDKPTKPARAPATVTRAASDAWRRARDLAAGRDVHLVYLDVDTVEIRNGPA